MRWSLALIALISGCAHVGSTAALRNEDWRAYTSEHFVVETPLGDSAARALVLRLEQYRAAMGVTLGAKEGLLAGPLRVIALANRADLALLGWPPEVAGFINLDGDEVVMGLEPTSQRETVPAGVVQAHELAHYFMAFVFQTMPRWFSEGMADYLGAIALEPGEFIVGRANPMRLADNRARYSLAELWQWGAQGHQLDVQRAYASAWRWVHFLVNAHPAAFTAFMQGLAEGQRPRVAFESAFAGSSLAQLEQQASDSLRPDQRYEIVRFPLPSTNPTVSVRAMSAPQVIWSLYLVSRTKDCDADLAHEAAQRFPRSVESLLIAAERATPPSPEAERALLDAQSNDCRVALHLAQRCELLPAGACEELTKRAMDLCPDAPVALKARLKQMTQTGDVPAALVLVQRLLRVAGYSRTALGGVVAALAAQGNCSDARAIGERATAAIPESASEATRAKYLAELDQALGACAP